MSTDTDEGMNLLAVFKERFASPDRTAARMKAEKRAGMTPAQRARKGPPKRQINFRAAAETEALLVDLVAHYKKADPDASQGSVIALALERLAAATKGFRGNK